MLRRIGRLLVVLAVLLPVGVVASAAANGASGGIGPAVLKCMHFKDGLALTPGLTNDTPTDQSVVGHGRLYGCNKAGGSAKFSATLHMHQATCADLSMAGQTRYDWANGQSSFADVTFTAQNAEPNKVFVTGVIGSGMFEGLVLQAWVRFNEKFSGNGPGCTAANPLKQIEFLNSQSYQLLTPPSTTSTLPQRPTTTTEPRSTTSFHTTTTRPRATTTTATTATTAPPTSTTASTEPPSSSTATTDTTVPVSNLGSTSSPTTAHPAGGGGGGTSPRGTNVVVVSSSTGGGLAFTGSNSAGALIGLESLIIGGALALLRHRPQPPARPGARPSPRRREVVAAGRAPAARVVAAGVVGAQADAAHEARRTQVGWRRHRDRGGKSRNASEITA